MSKENATDLTESLFRERGELDKSEASYLIWPMGERVL
jgi:hypothetical protein